MQLSFDVRASNSSTKDESLGAKTRHGDPGTEFGYSEVSQSDQQTSQSDMHMTLQLGSDEMLVDVGTSGKNSVSINSSAMGWNWIEPDDTFDGSTSSSVSPYINNSVSSWDYGMTPGGEDGYDPTTESSYDIDVTANDEKRVTMNGEDVGDTTVEVYRDYSEDIADAATAADEEPDEIIRRKTEASFHPGGSGFTIGFEKDSRRRCTFAGRSTNARGDSGRIRRVTYSGRTTAVSQYWSPKIILRLCCRVLQGKPFVSVRYRSLFETFAMTCVRRKVKFLPPPNQIPTPSAEPHLLLPARV